MLLSELYDQLGPTFPPYVRKDLQTAIRVLAKALQCADPQHCPLEQYNQPLPTLYRLVEDYLSAQGKGPHTVRNTKNNLSRLFRLAEQEQLFSLAPVILMPRYNAKQKPQRSGAHMTRPNGSYLRYAQWPPDLQEAFAAFERWATAPVVEGRPAHLRKRMSTVGAYKTLFEAYFGYLHHTKDLTPTFDALFDVDLVTSYVHWHVNDCHHKPTQTIRDFLKTVRALARQYRPLPEVCAQLLTLKKMIPPPSPTYNKADAWVSLATLEEVAKAIWPRKKPTDFPTHNTRHPGIRSAVHAGMSLMLRLWTYIPYRQRNMREMQLEENLRKDQGIWHIIFRSEQLKVGSKRGQANIFDLPFPTKLVPLLEDYLTKWRPLLLAKAPHPDNHVFLTQCGTVYTRPTLGYTTQHIVYRYTGKHWHPHIIRTVWATEMILRGVPLPKVAIMLNDKLETVIKNYAHLLDQNVAEEVYDLIDRRNGHGT